MDPAWTMLEGTIWSLGLLFIGCFNAGAAQDRRIRAGKLVTQVIFFVPAFAAVFVAFHTHVVLGLFVVSIGAYLWKELA